jgi:hypothetical protein
MDLTKWHTDICAGFLLPALPQFLQLSGLLFYWLQFLFFRLLVKTNFNIWISECR